MKKTELLAPAGNMESFYAAIEAGCDAIYMAGYSFGARAFATNFSDEEIIFAIKYAHLYGVKIYIAVNTIIYENEVELFMNYIDFLHKNNVDAIIIEDLGMFDLVRKTYPNLEIHISTQAHIHNISGAILMKRLGAKRVVLSRETSIDTIKKIKENSNVEVEVFVHGALCFSYSGQCLMSSLIGGRSGNRGKCAGTCRLKYNIVDDNNKKYNTGNYPISMKDLCTIENIGTLIELGIDSFKIEGRMKRPEYVYLVVSLYRKAIDSYFEKGFVDINSDDLLQLKKIYNRLFTKGYLFNERDVVNSYRPNHLGIKIGKVIETSVNNIKIKLIEPLCKGDGIRFLNKIEDTGIEVNQILKNNKSVLKANAGDEIILKTDVKCDIGSSVIKTTDIEQVTSINNNLKLKNRKILINAKINIKSGQKLRVFVSDGTSDLNYESTFVVQKALKKAITKDDVLKQFCKTNDTPYKFNNLEIELDNNSFVLVSQLNEVRREVISLLNEKRLYSTGYCKNKYNIELPNFENYERKNALVYSLDNYKKIKNEEFYNIYMKKDLYDKTDDIHKILMLDRVNEKNNGKANILVSELGSISDGCYTNFSFNVTNSYTVAFLHSIGVKRITLSHELTDKQIKELIENYKKRYNKHPNLELIVYGYIEAMISKYDLLKDLDITKNYYLQDRFNNKYRIIRCNNITTIYNYKITNRTDKEKYYFGLGINYLRYEFVG